MREVAGVPEAATSSRRGAWGQAGLTIQSRLRAGRWAGTATCWQSGGARVAETRAWEGHDDRHGWRTDAGGGGLDAGCRHIDGGLGGKKM